MDKSDSAAPLGNRAVVVNFSGGVTSAWCAGWALRSFPKEEITLLFHDTKEEHPDTYRFLREMAAALGLPITEYSDGRSVTELFRDENFLGNNQNAMCSRVLKVEQGQRHQRDLQSRGVTEIVKVFGFSAAADWKRAQRSVARGMAEGFTPRFPLIEEGITKQQAAEWCVSLGVQPSAMYCWAEHANCVGCVKGGRSYWLAVAKNAPEIFEQRSAMEEEFGHSIIRGGDREHVTLRELVKIGLKRAVGQRETIDVGACACGD